MRLAILFINYGPYHLARIESCYELFKKNGWDVVGIEIARSDNVYSWRTNIQNFHIPIFSIFGNTRNESVSFKQIYNHTATTLSQIKPDVLAIAGYAEKTMLSALIWCILHKKATILLSDSKKDDAPRYWWLEMFKSFLLKGYKSVLSAGKPHKRYLLDLGIQSDAIFFPYDVIGNSQFYPDTIKNLPKLIDKPYFLAINRFVPQKNILFLLAAYTNYRQIVGDRAWDLVLCGDGELRSRIEQQLIESHLQDSVHLPGFLQQQELLPYFAHASCFIHSSIQEQWGLVVNEAMAAGLPVLVSNRCGCFEDLVIEGVNGFNFDPENLQQLTDLMEKMSSGNIDLKKMGQASLEHIQKFSPDDFARGLMQAAEYALRRTSKTPI
jgi:1,2-diacylglycerol 3-alpha-glucosyltransferase